MAGPLAVCHDNPHEERTTHGCLVLSKKVSSVRLKTYLNGLPSHQCVVESDSVLERCCLIRFHTRAASFCATVVTGSQFYFTLGKVDTAIEIEHEDF